MSITPENWDDEEPDAVHPAAMDEDSLLGDCSVTRSRKGGPGGQHRNKVETAISIRHEPTGVIGAASERRSQTENFRIAFFRLRVNLALKERGYFTLRNAPSPLWVLRLDPEKRSFRVNPEHHDFPAILAEALDMLEALGWQPQRVSRVLGCSTTQLVRLLKLDPRALQVVNEHRAGRGDHPLQ